jgi:hypothetical protein
MRSWLTPLSALKVGLMFAAPSAGAATGAPAVPTVSRRPAWLPGRETAGWAASGPHVCSGNVYYPERHGDEPRGPDPPGASPERSAAGGSDPWGS